MSCYDWSKFPEWVNYVATDDDGEIWGYEHEPTRKAHLWTSSSGRAERIEEKPNDWKNSLEERPSDES